jgi:hypothetical protein
LDAAIEAVTIAVRDLHARGKQAFAAALKPELQRRFGHFDEHALGFTSFHSFLRAAEERGNIKLVAVGPHVQALPPEVASPVRIQVADQTIRLEPAKLIRRDLWRCFMDWTPGWHRLFDVERGEAVMFPEKESPLDYRDHVEARRVWRENPERFREIPAIERETQLGWMRQFAASLDDRIARSLITAAAEDEYPFREFTRVTRTVPGIAAQWNRFRVAKVAETIEAWAARWGLPLNVWEPVVSSAAPAPERTLDATSATVTTAVLDENMESAIRQRVHRIVDRLPVTELLKIKFSIEYTLFE